MDPDVIVVGAGHNGLVAAAYLARAGLRIERMTLAQQQEFTDFLFVRYYGGPQPPPTVDLRERTGALLRVAHTPPVGFEWHRPSGPGEELETLFSVRGQTREATLLAARQVDSQASPDQIVLAERSLAFAYIAVRREDGLRGLAIRATERGASIGGKHPRVWRGGRSRLVVEPGLMGRSVGRSSAVNAAAIR